jgi:hypothetical protein
MLISQLPYYLLRTEKLTKSYDRMIRKNLSRNKKTKHTVGLSFGSSAIFFPKKTRRFPSPSHGGFGFIGKISLD